MITVLPQLSLVLATNKTTKMAEFLVFIFLLNFRERKKVRVLQPTFATPVQTYTAPVFKNNLQRDIFILKKRILLYIKLGYSYKAIRRLLKLSYALLLFSLFEYTFNVFVKTESGKFDLLLSFLTVAVYIIILWLLKYF